MKKIKEKTKQLSFESDGKMGHSKKNPKSKMEKENFFNVTQDSE